MNLRGKKLLILGANPETIPLVQTANNMGVLTYVTSNSPKDAAKKFAYKACDVDGMDVNGLVNLIQQEKINGVLVGVADLLVPIYCKVCSILKLPCYATEKICSVFSNKEEFKKLCESFGIRGIPQYELTSEMKREDLDRIKFPVMVKPVDGYSGLGMKVCYNESDLRVGIEKALAFSKCKKFIVERYMQCEDMGIYYTFNNGKCFVSCIYDRNTTDEQPSFSRVNLGSIYPSKHTNDYFSKVHPNAVKMFKHLGIEHGVLLMSGFFENGEIYMYDPGFRLQGEAPNLLIKAIHGFDQREMLINFALTGFEGEFKLDNNDVFFKGKKAATLWFLLKKGVIKKIDGLDNIMQDTRIVANVQRLHEGDEVFADWIGTEKQVLTRLYLVCNDDDDLSNCINGCLDKVKVFDTEGCSMLLTGLNTKVIKEG